MSARPIFISYSSKDQRAAETVCTALESRGFPCWVAARDVGPGEDFQESIVAAIESAKAMVLVFTENANNSDEIKKELVLAGQHGVVVIPVRVEDIRPRGAFAYQLATRQWVDLFDDWERGIQRLSARVSALITPGDPPPQAANTNKADAPSAAAAAVSSDVLAKAQAAVPAADAPTHSPPAPSPAAATKTPAAKAPRLRRRTVLLSSFGVLGASAGAGAYFHQGIIDYFLNGPDRSLPVAATIARGALFPNGKTLALLMYRVDDRFAHVVDLATGQPTVKLDDYGYSWALTISPDGKWLAGGGLNRVVSIWDTQTGRIVSQFQGHTDSVNATAFSADSRWLASSSSDRTVRIWDVRSGQSVGTFTGHEKAAYAVAFMPDGKRLASAAVGAEMRFWEIATGRLLHSLALDQVSVDSIAFSPNGSLIAIAGQEQAAVRAYDTTTYERRMNAGGWGEIISVAYSPDGQWLAAGSVGLITLWTVAGTLVRRFVGHTGRVKCLAFSSDSRTLISGGDQTIKFWSVPENYEKASRRGY